MLGKDRGKPPGVHDPTRTRTPEGYIPLLRGKGYVRGTSGTPGLVGYPRVGQEECYEAREPNNAIIIVHSPHVSLRTVGEL